MNDRVEFDTVCPNNHNQAVTFSQKEFEEALESDTLVFHCNTCDTDWPPSSEEIAKLRKHFSKNSS
jgi:DNA-directed RNA polymerase subunit M/transcription elongation factor TFIIS